MSNENWKIGKYSNKCGEMHSVGRHSYMQTERYMDEWFNRQAFLRDASAHEAAVMYPLHLIRNLLVHFWS